ncbi:NADPH-dependent FMN reductase [Epibacterium sp. Ofav1-8]|uniref:NADPH-dependent FMN reductase n=1 Tax=Epibacterium sp. Ofav1-8 TaxID=2917735 RepID=UPI001EF4614C|nr:NADPH-dependent FMN reductase [Epibacterium sp. Ofav1-8]MCG7622473.1 NAD(P)H-dependent oxidoreductase [Epibacterium sp. Ofav1-8]
MYRAKAVIVAPQIRPYRGEMEFMAISGSARRASTNTALLRAVSGIVSPTHTVSVFAGLARLPVFSPDLEQHALPPAVEDFAARVGRSDGLIISSPEYVRALPGGLKNAIDWLVSREEIIAKPIALMHASHRGDDMLAQLRTVLSTVSSRFFDDVFLRFELMQTSPAEIDTLLQAPQNRRAVIDFVDQFAARCEGHGAGPSEPT